VTSADPLISHTAGDVWSYVIRQFGDESGVQIVNSDVIRWINQAQAEINSKNLILRSKVSIPSTASVDTYTKPVDCMRITAVRYDNMLLPYIGFDDYLVKYQGTPQTDYPVAWTQYGNGVILTPLPSDSNKTIDLFYIPETGNVTGNGDYLSLPDRYFDRICEYVMSKAYELDEDWNAHQVQRGLLENNLTAMSNDETNTQGPYPVVVDYSYDNRYSSDYVWYP
jgi:hypothetical protein